MKQPLSDQTQSRKEAANSLARTLVSLDDDRDCLALLEDLCTPAELEAIIDRWRVALLLNQGIPYRAIHESTGVSVTTIGRVARFLQAGTGGYLTALNQLKDT